MSNVLSELRNERSDKALLVGTTVDEDSTSTVDITLEHLRQDRGDSSFIRLRAPESDITAEAILSMKHDTLLSELECEVLVHRLASVVIDTPEELSIGMLNARWAITIKERTSRDEGFELHIKFFPEPFGDAFVHEEFEGFVGKAIRLHNASTEDARRKIVDSALARQLEEATSNAIERPWVITFEVSPTASWSGEGQGTGCDRVYPPWKALDRILQAA